MANVFKSLYLEFTAISRNSKMKQNYVQLIQSDCLMMNLVKAEAQVCNNYLLSSTKNRPLHFYSPYWRPGSSSSKGG